MWANYLLIRRSLLLVAAAMLMLVIGCTSSDDDVAAKLKQRELQRQSKSQSGASSREEMLRAAREALELGNDEEVQAISQKLLIKNPNDFEAVILSAQSHANAGFPLEAASRIQLVPDEDEQFGAQALTQAARWLAKTGDFVAAAESEAKLYSLHKDEGALIRQARLLNNSGRRLAGARVMWKILETQPLGRSDLLSLCALSDSYFFGSAGALAEPEALRPENLAWARWLRKNQKLDEALELTSLLRQEFSESTAISAFYGRLCAEMQRNDLLAKWLGQASPQLAGEPEFWFAAGVAFQNSAAMKEATRCFMEAVVLDPTDRFSYLRLSETLSAIDQADAASQALSRFQLLKQTHRFSVLLSEKQSGSSAKVIDELAETLDQLGRPREACAWRLLASKSSGLSQAELQQTYLDMIAESRQSQSEFFLTCGVDRNQWALPIIEGQIMRAESMDPKYSAEQKNSIALVDVASQKELEFNYKSGAVAGSGIFYIHHQTGGGIGVLDFDRDGWPDCYCVQSGGEPMDSRGSDPNELFRNLSGERYVAVGQTSRTDDRGYGAGIAASDVNQDGFVDLVVANIGVNVVFVNNGDGTFRRFQLSDESHWTTSIATGDLSGDGLPEIVEVNYTDAPKAFQHPCRGDSPDCSPKRYLAQPDLIYSVQANGQISMSGLTKSLETRRGHGFGALIGDFDQQAGNELFVVNDTDENHFWLPTVDSGQQKLVDVASLRGCATGIGGARRGCMGLAVGDFDRNGSFDFHVTNFMNEESDLYLQLSSSFQNETSAYRMVTATTQMVGWGTQAVDFDHDGWTDLAVLNGNVVDVSSKGIAYKMKPQIFRHEGNHFQLLDAQDESYWSKPALGRALASTDFDRDGRVDLIAGHLDSAVALLENQSTDGHFLQLVLVGTASERDAIGATLKVTTNQGQFVNCQTGGDGFLCTNEPLLDFGLGNATRVKSLEIQWPSGQTQVLSNLVIDQRYLVVEDQEDAFLINIETDASQR